MNNPHGIIIVRRADEAPEIGADESLQRYTEESEPEASGAARMFALLLLVMAAAGIGGIVGLISYLAQ